MSITSADILTYAQSVLGAAGTNEVNFRAVVGRAYYAAFHDSSDWHNSLPLPGSLPITFNGGTHAQLRERLTNPAPSLASAEKMKSKRRGYALRALHDQRVEADYHLNETVDLIEARQSVANAATIIAIV